MNYKRFFFVNKAWLAAELLALFLLACSAARAADTRSEGLAIPAEPVTTATEGLAPEALRDNTTLAPRLPPLDAMQGAVKNVFSSALETVQSTVQSSSLLESGVASWYGSAFHGRRTASGERFDMHQLTAAHKTLPLGTVVQVRNPLNGKTVDVKINDRGPFIKGRIIDLSYRAALALGIVQAGKLPVEVHRR